MSPQQKIHRLLGDYLGKSGHGEGSRGGHIIGHTRAGRPIYSHEGTFHGRDAHFDKAYSSDDGDVESTMAVPLGGGFTARFRAVAEDATHPDPEYGSAEGHWAVHGPNGDESHTHHLAADFFKHPDAGKIEGEAIDEATRNAAGAFENEADTLHDRWAGH